VRRDARRVERSTPVRRLRYQVAASLDGYIAGPHGEFDWIPMDPAIDFTALWAQYDTVVMGRKTFEASGAMASGRKGIQVVVYSTTLDPAAHKKIAVVTSDPVAHVRELKAQPGKDIWLFGGGALFRTLLEAGVVDTVEPAICPILLGGGIPLLPTTAARAMLSLTRHTVYQASGIVLLEYAVVR
jgi:dihydrofolate reductase